jgi:predicted Zn-dependent protease
LKLAEVARTGLEKDKHLRNATALCQEYNRKAATDTYGYVTLAKIGLSRLDDALESGDAIGIEQSVKDIESSLQDGFQRFPGNSYLREAEARLAERLSDSDRAVEALEKALKANARSAYIANRLAQLYRKRGDNDKAKQVLEAALSSNANEKRLHFAYSKLLLDIDGDKTTHPWRFQL